MNRFSRCPGCGAVNDPDSPFCYLCGRPDLITACPGCGSALVNPFRQACHLCGREYAGFAGTRKGVDRSTGERGSPAAG